MALLTVVMGEVAVAENGPHPSTDGTEGHPPDETVAAKDKPHLRRVDGGVKYYKRFTNPLPTSPDFFPIGVWGAYDMTPENVAKDVEVGINTYVWFADTTTKGWVENARRAGMHLIVNGAEGGSRLGSETFARLLGDEIDMTQGAAVCPRAVDEAKSSLPNEGRARYANYGKGVLIWGAEEVGGHNDTTSACFINSQDITSTDLYWHTDPYEADDARSGLSSSYGWSIRRMRKLDAMDGRRTPQWGFVEVTNAMNGPWGAPGPAEIRSAVWHTLIAGARGVIYFQHDFEGSCLTHHALRETGDPCYDTTIRVVTKVDHQVGGLARVLNSPFVIGGHHWHDSMPGKVRSMVKRSKGAFWVFAGADRGGGRATFSMSCVGRATAKVKFEDRSLPVRDGSFTDSFANRNSVHVYKIIGGSRCGLS